MQRPSLLETIPTWQVVFYWIELDSLIAAVQFIHAITLEIVLLGALRTALSFDIISDVVVVIRFKHVQRSHTFDTAVSLSFWSSK